MEGQYYILFESIIIIIKRCVNYVKRRDLRFIGSLKNRHYLVMENKINCICWRNIL